MKQKGLPKEPIEEELKNKLGIATAPSQPPLRPVPANGDGAQKDKIKKQEFQVKGMYVLLLDGENYGRVLVPKRFTDGEIEVDNKIFLVKDTKPYIINLGGKYYLFYILRHDTLLPADIHFIKTDINPEFLKMIDETYLLSKLIKKKRFVLTEGKQMILGIVIGLIIAGILSLLHII